ncbi:MAG: histidinol-phosphate aminotransferase family protein [Pseudonocardiales bacterium]|nr:histidinol-phosphate aminotransferase family protein [Pseudonocardiales bacterium]
MNSTGAGATELRIPQRILDASPYVPEWSGLNRTEFIRLDRNENTRPLPAAVQEALVRSIASWAVQSYPESAPIQRSLASYTRVPSEYILSTNGSDQGIDLCLRTALSEGDSILIARPEFPVFSHVAEAIGAKIEPVPYNPDLSFPYRAFAEAIASVRPSLIVLINPNNPTGSGIDIDYIEQIIASNPKTIVIVDEAYYEYTDNTVVPLVKEYANLLVLRTFSKAFAMAGLRLGYVLANPQILAHVRKLQNPFDVNQLAVTAGLAQLARTDAVRAECRHAMEEIKPYVVQSLLEVGVEVWPGSANFLLVRPPDCTKAVAYLRNSGVLVRSMSAPALQGSFRVSLGTMHEMQQFVGVFQSYLKEYRGSPSWLAKK